MRHLAEVDRGRSVLVREIDGRGFIKDEVNGQRNPGAWVAVWKDITLVLTLDTGRLGVEYHGWIGATSLTIVRDVHGDTRANRSRWEGISV